MAIPDLIKRALIDTDRLSGLLERHGIVTYADRARLLRDRYLQPVRFGQEGNDRIAELLDRDRPLMVTRLGSVELSCLRFFQEQRGERKSPYDDRIRRHMAVNAGFFPTDDAALDRFADTYLDLIPRADLMAVWFNRGEDTVCNRYCPRAGLVDFDCLEPFRFPRPWSARLAGKRVLVVHPFAATIERQYREKRTLLFTDGDVLPPFELTTVTAVQSAAGAAVPFPTWFDAYRHLCDRMAAAEFDICLIGAGAYGLPLAAFAKGLGKQALHLGGATQLLFGIRGRRWEQPGAEATSRLFNEHWVRPDGAETPAGKHLVEKGCYW